VLPELSLRWVPDAKVRDYCLSDASPKSLSRKRFFEAQGFSAAAWRILQQARHEQAATGTGELVRADAYGNTYRVIGPLACPDGRAPTITTYWIIRADDPRPQFTSAIPGPLPQDNPGAVGSPGALPAGR